MQLGRLGVAQTTVIFLLAVLATLQMIEANQLLDRKSSFGHSNRINATVAGKWCMNLPASDCMHDLCLKWMLGYHILCHALMHCSKGRMGPKWSKDNSMRPASRLPAFKAACNCGTLMPVRTLHQNSMDQMAM